MLAKGDGDEMAELDAKMAQYRLLMRTGLAELLDGAPPFRPLYDMMAYQFGWLDADLKRCVVDRGKYLRPALCFLACESVGGTAHEAISGALAVELLHNFSLVHDDIQDGSTLRRNRAAVWTVWGMPHAINVGDGLFALAHLTLAAAELAEPTRAAVGRVFSRTCIELCEGQFLDLSFERASQVGLDDYTMMARKKTAALFGCAAELGALLGGATAEMALRRSEFGLAVGEAFQASDDVLGVWGDERQIGKPATDVRDRKRGLPAVIAFARSSGTDLATLTELYSGNEPLDDEAVDWIMRLFDRLEVRDQAMSVVNERFHRAEAMLATTAPPVTIAYLRQLVDSIPRPTWLSLAPGRT